MNINSECCWGCIGLSVRGAEHILSDTVNQDCISWFPGGGSEPPLTLAVSDGHGSAIHCRSERGSQYAIDAALEVTRQFADKLNEEPTEEQLQNAIKHFVPKKICEHWETKVEENLRTDPLNFFHLTTRLSEDDTRSLMSSPRLAYGATLIVALVTKERTFYWQLGDGDILTVDAGGVKRPLPEDKRLIADETTSLCMENAHTFFRCLATQTTELQPLLIMLSTDGYANSYPGENNFRAVAQDYFTLLKDEGQNEVNKRLEEFLTATSQEGSGDDITLGLIHRLPTAFISMPPIPKLSVLEDDDMTLTDRQKLTEQIETLRADVSKIGMTLTDRQKLTEQIETLRADVSKIGIAIEVLKKLPSIRLSQFALALLFLQLISFGGMLAFVSATTVSKEEAKSQLEDYLKTHPSSWNNGSNSSTVQVQVTNLEREIKELKKEIGEWKAGYNSVKEPHPRDSIGMSNRSTANAKTQKSGSTTNGNSLTTTPRSILKSIPHK
jgi:Protein phosphatase 2C